MKQNKGLGRGLEAIFGAEKSEPKDEVVSSAVERRSAASVTTVTEISLLRIIPNAEQPRRDFAETELEQLRDSIKEVGIIQPITLRHGEGGNYMIISGERRWRAARMAGLQTIPAYIREVDDEQMQIMALVENLQRENLNPIEVAQALQRLVEECGLTQEAVAQRVSMKRPTLTNYLRLNRMQAEIQIALKGGEITMGHAKAIASVDDAQLQIEVLKICIERSLSVRETEALAQRASKEGLEQKSGEEEAKSSAKSNVPKGFEGLSSYLCGIFPKGVNIKSNSRGGGRITIDYTNKSELQQLMRELDLDME